jgi:hypothetical protein
MTVLGPTTLTDVLVEWGIHECEGRLKNLLPVEFVEGVSRPDQRPNVLHVLLQARASILAAILAGEPIQCVRVQIIPDDISRLRVLGQPSTSLTDSIPAYDSGIESGPWISNLVAQGTQVEGPFLAVGRNPEGLLTLLDGVHRAVAWAKHAQSGNHYPVVVNVVVTQQAAAPWE